VDPADGLLYAGEPGEQLTWMDAKVGDWVVTPRTGKAVEINALWINALETMAGFARLLKKSSDTYDAFSRKAKDSFQKFWNPQRGCCYDVLMSRDRQRYIAAAEPDLCGGATRQPVKCGAAESGGRCLRGALAYAVWIA